MYPSASLSRRAINFRPGSIPRVNVRFRGPDYKAPPFPANPPPTLHPSAASINRTMPQELKIRRTRYPAHHLSSPSPLSDPDLHDPTSPKRLPLKLDQHFHKFRERGFYPGTAEEGRATFLQDMWSWRSRLRGELWMSWNAKLEEWKDSSFMWHFYKQAVNRGQVGMIKPWEDEVPISDLHIAGVTYNVRTEDLNVQAMLDAGLTREEVDDYPLDVPYDIPTEFINWESVDEYQKLGNPEWRSGLKKVITGKRIYLPNIIIRLTRNRVYPGEPYDPYIATFRIPISMTKVDMRSYLKAVYDLDITFIRTDIYRGSWQRKRLQLNGRRSTVVWRRDKGRKHDYKRAVVGLFEPFHYPDDIEELRAFGREAGVGYKFAENRQSFLADHFMGAVESTDETRALNRSRYRRTVGDLSKQYMENRAENQDIKFREGKIRQLMYKRLHTEDAIANEAKRYRKRLELSTQGISLEEAEKTVRALYPDTKPAVQRDRKRQFRLHGKPQDPKDTKEGDNTASA